MARVSNTLQKMAWKTSFYMSLHWGDLERSCIRFDLHASSPSVENNIGAEFFYRVSGAVLGGEGIAGFDDDDLDQDK
eukprot:scaffold2975_cov135-Skeletonema_menzelii.AAC.1